MNLYDYSLLPTRLETPLQIPFWICLERKRCSGISKIFERYLRKTARAV